MQTPEFSLGGPERAPRGNEREQARKQFKQQLRTLMSDVRAHADEQQRPERNEKRIKELADQIQKRQNEVLGTLTQLLDPVTRELPQDLQKEIASEFSDKQSAEFINNLINGREKYGNDKPDLRDDKTDPNLLAFCWVIDFPFFEKTDTGAWTFTHNPFSRPKPEHMEWLMNKENIGEILTTQYDVALNGFEIGGGSIRNHDPKALEKVFEIMGHSIEGIKANFGHMMSAFSLGTPPHGGIAWGLDRLVMLLQNEPNIREVIPFAKTGEGKDPMMDSPSEISDEQLLELNIKTLKVK
jgi:aspartyl-tRNA synthetase